MTLLVDSHAFVWWVTEDPRISRFAGEALLSRDRLRYISAATGFELTNKLRLGKLPNGQELVDRLEELVKAAHFTVLPITLPHAHFAGRLPGAPRDPFDRLIAAQAIIEGVPVLSVDSAFAALGAETVW